MKPRTLSALAALASIAAVLAGSWTFSLASASHASGGSVPDAVIDGSNAAILAPSDGAIRFNTTYDLTFTNVSASFGSTGFRLHDVDGNVTSSPRDAAADGAHPGRSNVTFPSATHMSAGNWTLRNATGAVVVQYVVSARDSLRVIMNPNPIQHSMGSVSFTITVGPLASGQTAQVSGPGIPAGTTVSGPSGQFAYFGPSPGVGTHTYRAQRQLHASAAPEETGQGTLTVTQAVPTFRIGNVSGGSLPIRVPIELAGASDFGSATVTLAVDPAVVQVANASAGTIPGATTTWSVNNSTGTLTVLVTTTARPGANGSFVFAFVTLRTVGAAGETSPLDIGLVEAVRSDGSAFDATMVDGAFRAGLVGDADGDGDIDEGDADAIADYVVGRRPTIVTANADVTRDGRVTGADAMFLRQFRAGTRSGL